MCQIELIDQEILHKSVNSLRKIALINCDMEIPAKKAFWGSSYINHVHHMIISAQTTYSITVIGGF